MTSPRKLFLDTVPPRPVVKFVSPDSISPDGAGGGNSAKLRFAGPTRRARLLVFRTDLPRPRIVARRDIPRGESTRRWDGRVAGGGAAPTGAYLLVVRAQDAAGNVGPAALPPTRRTVRGHPGLAVTYVAARGPAGGRRGRRRAIHGCRGRPALPMERAAARSGPPGRPRSQRVGAR